MAIWHGKPKFLPGMTVSLLPDAALQKVPYPPVVLIQDVGEVWTKSEPKDFKGFIYQCLDAHNNKWLLEERFLQPDICYKGPDENGNWRLEGDPYRHDGGRPKSS